MYRVEEKFKSIVKGMNLEVNATLSTNSLYQAISKYSGFSNTKTIRKFLLSLETFGFIERDKELVGMWIIKKLPDIDPYLEV